MRHSDWVAEILAILDESEGIRERISDLESRMQRAGVLTDVLQDTRNNFLLLETVLGNVVDAQLLAIYDKFSTVKKP